jgi:plasmid stability protein
MATLLVRELDDELVRLLKQRAKSHARSTEAEHRAILEAALRPGGESFIARARRLQQMMRGRVHSDSTAVIRVDRDNDYGNPDGAQTVGRRSR